jgi:hypothetical protein
MEWHATTERVLHEFNDFFESQKKLMGWTADHRRGLLEAFCAGWFAGQADGRVAARSAPSQSLTRPLSVIGLWRFVGRGGRGVEGGRGDVERSTAAAVAGREG